MKKILIFTVLISNSIFSQETKIDSFLDLYYAYDFNKPVGHDRDYTTQPVRNDEFNLNLAMLGATYTKEKLKARLALQAGTYVQSNYSAEPSVGSNSGSSLARHIQDAYVEYLVKEKTTLIAGIFASHVGYESVLSIDNWTYSRSLAADYSPYYQSGVGIKQVLNQQWMVEGYVVNGWQNISEDDSNKMLGVAVRYAKDRLKLNYTNLHGKYLQDTRSFHDFNFIYDFNDHFSVKGLFDIAWQKNTQDSDEKFYTYNVQTIYKQKNNSYSLRAEYYNDPHQLNITTPNSDEFKVWGYSAGYDHLLDEGFVWRVEYRSLFASENIFHKENGFSDKNNVVMTSLAGKF